MDRFEDVAGAEREGFDFQAFNAGVAPMEAGVGDPAHGAEEQLLPSLSEIGLVPPRIGSTIRHVPKRLNTAFTELKTRALREAGQRNDLTAWTKLLMLPICVLRRIPSPRGGKRRKQHFRKQLTAIIKTRIERWKNGDLAGLWEEVMSEVEEDAARRHVHPQPEDSKDDQKLRASNARRAKRLAQDGHFARGVAQLRSDGIAAPSPEVLASLRSKHPAAEAPEIPAEVPAPAMTFDQEQVIKAVHSFGRGAAGGSSHLRPEHLVDSIRCPVDGVSFHFTSALTKAVNVLAKGEAPATIAEFLAGAPLVALNKKHGGIRPIAIGEVLRRLVSKCFCAALKDRAAALFSPHQVGVGIKGGCEAAIRAVSLMLAEFGDNPSMVMLKVDFENAFNGVDRAEFIKEVRRLFPELARWVEWCYSRAPFLWWNGNELRSRGGVQQGDPLGPFLFSLVLHSLVLKIKEECPDLKLNIWFLDDGTIVGSIPLVLKAYNIIGNVGPALGLNMNVAKCEVHWPTMDMEALSCFPAAVKRVSPAGVDLLGAPMGSTEFCHEYIRKHVVRKTQSSLEALADIEDSQIEVALLRSCLGQPKTVYAMRTLEPEIVREPLEEFDELVYKTLHRAQHRRWPRSRRIRS